MKKKLLAISVSLLAITACSKLNFSRNDSVATVRSVHGPTVEQVSQTVWEITQRTTGKNTPNSEASRMILSLGTADHDPVGLRKKGDSSLVVNVTVLSGDARPQLLVGSYDRGETVKTYELTPGINTITGAAGDLYLRFAADQPSAANKVKVEFVSGYEPVPFYILGTTTNQQWKDMLAYDTTPNAILVSNKSFVVCSRTKAIEFQDKNQDSALIYIDRAINAEHEISGLDGTTGNDKTWEGKIMIVEIPPANPNATDNGRVRMPDFKYVLDYNFIISNGWGLFHEIGHHHQMRNWTFEAVGETNPNIYTLAAYRKIVPGYTWLKGSGWADVLRYLALPDSTRDYTTSVASNFVRLGLQVQLWLAFGDTFYHSLHKLVRAEKPAPVGNREEEMRVFMLYACRASGKDLSSFFKKWGFKVPQSYYDEIANLNLPQPTVDITTLSEDPEITGIPEEPAVGVVFYESYSYGGKKSARIPKGSYTVNQMGIRGVADNWASSVKIPAGWTITLYENDNFTGNSWILNANTSSFGSLSPTANDKVSSIKIE